MTGICRGVLSLGLFVLCAGPFCAQVSRFELGQRLLSFEQDWKKYDNAEGRGRASLPLVRATPYFFSFQLGEAGRALDQARHLLKSEKKVNSDRQWAESLFIVPQYRLLPTTAKKLTVKVQPFYKVESKIPAKAEIRLTLQNGKGKAVQAPFRKEITVLPMTIAFPLRNQKEDDCQLIFEVLLRGEVVHASRQTLSLVRDPGNRLAALQDALEKSSGKNSGKNSGDNSGKNSGNNAGINKSTDRETIRTLVEWLENLRAGATLEMNFPAARLLREAEEGWKVLQRGDTFYDRDQTGEFWLNLVTEKGPALVRVFVPEAAKSGKPIPLVVALHGAGGSENLFFEAYGAGEVVKQCQKRGWMVVAPRTNGFVFNAPVAAIVEALAKRYPLDKNKVFLVGHSMGAAQAISAAQANPSSYAGVAALGGSGRIKKSAKIDSLSFFVGAGTRDFAFEGARRLADMLKSAGAGFVQFREYANIEHIVIVQIALPDVFAFFDRNLQNQEK
ncbi:MAG: hypothetical protein AB7P49_19035 [Bdellovibrionales bacterium]